MKQVLLRQLKRPDPIRNQLLRIRILIPLAQVRIPKYPRRTRVLSNREQARVLLDQVVQVRILQHPERVQILKQTELVPIHKHQDQAPILIHHNLILKRQDQVRLLMLLEQV